MKYFLSRNGEVIRELPEEQFRFTGILDEIIKPNKSFTKLQYFKKLGIFGNSIVWEFYKEEEIKKEE